MMMLDDVHKRHNIRITHGVGGEKYQFSIPSKCSIHMPRDYVVVTVVT